CCALLMPTTPYLVIAKNTVNRYRRFQPFHKSRRRAMNKQHPGRKAIKRRPGRGEMVRARRAASQMATVEDLAAELGIGKNAAYEIVASGRIPGVFRYGRRYLIPRTILAKIVSGEMLPPAA